MSQNNGERIIWEPTPKQREFLECSAREVLLGGSLGGGKTDALLMAALSQTGNPLHRAIVFRKSFPQTRDLVARSFELFLPLGAEFNQANHQWTFPSKAKIEVGFLDSPVDQYRYLGRSFSFIGFDELGMWEGDSTDANGEPVNGSYLYLLSRLRAVEGANLRLEIRATCNPAGPGHSWIQTRWKIPADGSRSECIDPATGFRRVFIPSRIADNPYLRDTSYARSLEALPEASRRALLEGRWDSWEGQTFTSWNPFIHVCEPFPIPVDWDLWRGADDGFASPFACYWLTRNPKSDTYYVIDELYATRLMPDEIAARVIERDLSIQLTDQRGGHGTNRKILKGMLDSAAFAETGQAVITRGDQMNALGCNWIPVEKFPGSRIARVKNFHRMLAPNPKAPPGKPGIVFFSTCKHAIATIPALQCSERDPEDIEDAGEVHAFDGVTYALQYKKPLPFRRVRVG